MGNTRVVREGWLFGAIAFFVCGCGGAHDRGASGGDAGSDVSVATVDDDAGRAQEDAAQGDDAASSASTEPVLVVPRILVRTNENALDRQGFTYVVNGSGLSSPLDDGASLDDARAVTHSFGLSYLDSYATRDSGLDYFMGFGAERPPTVVFDLGADVDVTHVVLWQYENAGGSGGHSEGNSTRTLTLAFNGDAEGYESFLRAPTEIALLPVQDGDHDTSNDLGGMNRAQVFELGTHGRYVALTITDNYRGLQGIDEGGDRAGLGEVRFAVRGPQP